MDREEMRAALAEAWRLYPDTFAQRASGGKWKPYSYLKLIAKRILPGLVRGGGRYIVTLPPRHGKALALETPILTPRGWTTMGELRPGDSVYHPSGQAIEVLGVSPVWRDREVWRVITDDGAEVLADGDHLWTVRLCRKYRKWKNWRTADLAARSSLRNPMIPEVAASPELSEKDLPIDPYTLGVWLGDGHSGCGIITKHERDADHVIGRIRSAGWVVESTDGRHRVVGLSAKLRALGLIKNKRIPPMYLEASSAQRLALLQGLIDTDGYVAPTGQIEFCSIIKALAEDVRRLIWSLGVKASFAESDAKLYGRVVSKRYRLSLYHPAAASLPRKAENCRASIRPNRYIHLEPGGRADTVCIQVDSPDGLFLAGHGLIATHNSEFISHWLPTWYLDTFPQRRIGLGAYSASFAKKWGRKVKREFETNPLLRHRVNPLANAANYFEIECGRGNDNGLMMTAGVDGPFTGEGFHLIIIDDPIKNWKEAASETRRQTVKDWFQAVVETRLEPNATVIILMTRWHEDDLVGWLLAAEEEADETGAQKNADPWELINLPALAEENDLLGREPGEALCPERYTAPALEERRRRIGERFWNALFQQKPTSATGEVWKRAWWKFWEEKPAFDQVIQSWDLRFGDNKNAGSYVVGQVWGCKGADYYLIYQVRGRWSFEESKAEVIRVTTMFPQAKIKLVENKANGPALESNLKTAMTGIRLVDPGGSKFARASACEGAISSGHVHLPPPERYEWVTGFIEEASAFSAAGAHKHDDQVDAAAQAILYFEDRTNSALLKLLKT